MASDSDDNKKQNARRTVSYVREGKPEHIDVEVPNSADPHLEEEAAHSVQTLEDNHEIQYESGPLKPGKTHQVEADHKGNKFLVRKRYSAI